MASRRGLVLVFTGDGKGKTTAAFGQALRAIGCGMRVAIVQFVKARDDCGEIGAARRLAPALTVHVCGAGFIVPKSGPTDEDRQAARRGLDLARDLMRDPGLDMLILDELSVAVHLGLVSVADVLQLVDGRRPDVHLVITGRNAPQPLIDRADLVTEMREVKHPYNAGVPAQKGIEE